MLRTLPHSEGWATALKKKTEKTKSGFFARFGQKWCGMGIQSRVFLCFFLFIAFLLVLLWLFQIKFLDIFYRNEKEKMLKKNAEIIMDNITHSECGALVEHLAKEDDLCILVYRNDMEPLFSGEGLSHCVVHNMNKRDLRRLVRPRDGEEECRFVLMSRYIPRALEDQRFNGPLPKPDNDDTRCLVSVHRRKCGDDEYTVLITCLVAPVQSTVKTIRSQLYVITIILLLVGFVASSMLSMQISTPIVKITKEARRLSYGEYTPVTLRGHYKEVGQLNRQLTQAAEDLRKVDTLQRELMVNISHDLRTPLTLIEGYVEAMQDIPGENTPENLQIILDETRRLTSLVNSVLEYSRGMVADESAPERYSLTESIASIIGRYAKLIDKEGYHIVFEHDGEAWVKAHPLKISQVIYNLINNALTYTGGDKLVTVRQTIGKDKVRIEIVDSGEGISKEDIPHIWDRYYRGKKPHVRPAAGTGLGLNIARDILRSYQLEYGVESEEEKGSCFWFELPLDTEP